MIVDLHKYLIYGNKSDMDRFFALSQRTGFLEFIGLSHKKALELPEHAKMILSAIKIAKHHFIHPKEAPDLEPLKIAETILFVNGEKEKLLEEQRILTAEISRIAVFGDFSRDDVEWIEREARRVLQFFCMKSDLAHDMSLPPELVYIGTEYDLDYFAAINKERVQYPKMIEILIERSAGELRKRLFLLREELARSEADLRTFCNALPALQNGLDDCINEYTLRLARHDASTPLGDALFAIEAWVPKNRLKSLDGLLSDLEIECVPVAIEPTDRIPTCLENKGIPKLGEDLIHIYDTPAYNDKDPSGWVLFFFILFFSMIISDAGYGLLFLGMALAIRWILPANAPAATRRFAKLFLFLSVGCILWGTATASFFGVAIRPDNPFRKSSFIHYLAMRKAEYHLRMKDDVYAFYVKDFPAVSQATGGHDFLMKTEYIKEGKPKFAALDTFYLNILLELSLVIGILHLSTSFLRYLLRSPVGLGWIIFMLGGYLYFPIYLSATTIANFLGWAPKPLAATIGVSCLALGPALVLLISLLEKKKWMALHELSNGIQVFSDILSYLRLYALALAGMVMADTANTTLGIDFGIIGTILVVFFGHVINMSMSVMSAAIHGLRLNFLEWYRYSFIGGGRLFNPLRLRKIK